MSSLRSIDRNSQRHNIRAAKSHWIYATDEVLELYGIAPNTLTAWKKQGLPATRGVTDLYLGQDLNAFHVWYKRHKARPQALTEVYCVHCKQSHQIHINSYRIERNETDSPRLIVECPITGGDAYKFISPDEIDLIQKGADHNYRTEEVHYNVDRLGSKTAIFPDVVAKTKNSDNLLIRRDYQIYLMGAEGFSEKTVIAALRHIAQFDNFTAHRNYSAITRDTVIAFKRALEAKRSPGTFNKLSASTIVHTLLDLKKFFHWLETVAPAKSIPKGLSIYFAPSRELSALANVREKDRTAPSLEQVRTMVLAMPAENFEQRRDQALLAFMLISGVRISALLTLQLQHIDLEKRSIRQDPRVVKTKNSKDMQTAWFPVGDDIEAIFINWIVGLQAIHKNHSTPLFPRAVDPIRRQKSPDEIPPLLDQGIVRKIIKRACATVNLPYFTPHAIRKTLALLGNELCNTAKLRKAWSQNLGHKHVATTDYYYAKLDTDEQFAAFDDIRANILRHDADELVRLLPQLTVKQIAAITQVARGYTESEELA